MKKVISLLLALVMCLSLCACGGGNDKFETEYASMINRVETLNADTSRITGIVYGTWYNVGVSFDVVFRMCEVLEITPKELFDFRD